MIIKSHVRHVESLRWYQPSIYNLPITFNYAGRTNHAYMPVYSDRFRPFLLETSFKPVPQQFELGACLNALGSIPQFICVKVDSKLR